MGVVAFCGRLLNSRWARPEGGEKGVIRKNPGFVNPPEKSDCMPLRINGISFPLMLNNN
jgi:hypothetical protein